MNAYKTLITILERVVPTKYKGEFFTFITNKEITLVGADLQTITLKFENGKLIHWE